MINTTNSEQTMPKMLVGTDDFQKLLLESDIFVDKTLLIKEFIENSSETVLITRPRRWGKSINMDMIAKFLQIEVDNDGNRLSSEKKIYDKLFIGGEVDLGFTTARKKLIKPLKIANYPDIIQDYQGKFPVIQLNFKEVKGSSYQEIEDGVKHQVIKMCANHEYLLHSNLLNDTEKIKLGSYLNGNFDLILIKDSVNFLSTILHKHFGIQVYVLIDEYDTPINTAYIEFYEKNRSDFDKVIKLFQGIFGAALKGNTSLKKGLVTGILRVAKANIFSGLNNLAEDCLLDEEFSKFYGFTESEVEELLLKIPTQTDPAQIKRWYNGYYIGGQTIYNPWSIMQTLRHRGKCDTYWVDSGGTGLLDKVLLSDKVQEELQMLLEGVPLVKRLHKHIAFDQFESDTNVFYSLLLFAGYLNAKLIPLDNDEEEPKYELSIPNRELRNIYKDRVFMWTARKLNIDIGACDNLTDLLIEKKIDLFMEQLSDCFINATSYFDLAKEKDYHNLMGGLLLSLVGGFTVESNRPTGHGRCDHILIPRLPKYNTAFIFEYKLSKNQESMETDSRAALAQINDNHYDAPIKNHSNVTSIVKIGMAFYKREFHFVMQE